MDVLDRGRRPDEDSRPKIPTPPPVPIDPLRHNDMARAPITRSLGETSIMSPTVAAGIASDVLKPQRAAAEVASPNDTDVDDDEGSDERASVVHSDDELCTPVGIGEPAEFDDEEFASHRFTGPTVPGDNSSARALHGLRSLMVHSKPPKFGSEASSVRPSFVSTRLSLAVSMDLGSRRSFSLEQQPLNSYQVTFSESNPHTGFTTRLSFSEETSELAVRVASVERDSPAFKAGVVVGDTMLCVNEHVIEPHMTGDQVEDLLASQRGARTIVFARQCSDSPTFHHHGRSHSEGCGSVEKKPKWIGRFSKPKLTSALSYGSSLVVSKLKRRKTVIHKGISCEGCGVESIVGALWTCSVCPNYNLCTDCYECGTHGMENTDSMQMLNEARVQFRLQKKCKRFSPEFLLSLRRDICKGRPDKFEYMGGWIADIVNGTAPSKIKVRGIEIPHLPPTSRQRFVSNLMPLVSNRTDIEVNIEWLPDDIEPDRPSIDSDETLHRVSQSSASSNSNEDRETLRIWISDKKSRTASPFT